MNEGPFKRIEDKVERMIQEEKDVLTEDLQCSNAPEVLRDD